MLNLEYFCNLDWWNTKEAYQPIKGRFSKYGVKGETTLTCLMDHTVHFWRDRFNQKYDIDIDAAYHHPKSLGNDAELCRYTRS